MGKSISWNGATVELPFTCEVYQDQTVKIENRLSRIETEIPGYAAAVYHTIMEAEKFSDHDTIRAGMEWLQERFPESYMILFDSTLKNS